VPNSASTTLMIFVAFAAGDAVTKAVVEGPRAGDTSGSILCITMRLAAPA
jgi:hypothetical protein